MATARIGSGTAVGKTGATTTGFDSTGATLLIVKVCHWNGNLTGTVTDSKGNTWTALTDQRDGTADVRSRIFYCISPSSVGASHTASFTPSAGDVYCGVEFEAYSGGTFSFDAENSAGSTSGTTQQPGSVTPGTATNVVVTCTGFENTATLTIDLGFTIGYQVGLNGASNYGFGGGYLLDASGAENPTWTFSAGTAHAASIASFSYTPSGGSSSWGAQLSDLHNKIVANS